MDKQNWDMWGLWVLRKPELAASEGVCLWILYNGVRDVVFNGVTWRRLQAQVTISAANANDRCLSQVGSRIFDNDFKLSLVSQNSFKT